MSRPRTGASRSPGIAPPCDADIRHTLLQRLTQAHAGDPETVIMEELGLCKGRVRVDVAVVNGSFHGYEIKSDRDTLRRLVEQSATYSRVLDRATLIVGARHARHAVVALPPWWGVIVVQLIAGEIRLAQLRAGHPNPRRHARSLVELLWLDQAKQMLAARDALQGYRSRPRREVWDRVCDVYGVDEIASAVREHLKARAARQFPQRPG